MKRCLTVIFLLFSFAVFAQIGPVEKIGRGTTVGKIAPMGAFIAELSYTVNGSDTVYTLNFNDASYTKIDVMKTVVFSGKGNAMELFYNNFKSVFTDENRKNKDYFISFTLGTDNIYIKGYKSMGVATARILVDSATMSLTEKQVDKLFGK